MGIQASKDISLGLCRSIKTAGRRGQVYDKRGMNNDGCGGGRNGSISRKVGE